MSAKRRLFRTLCVAVGAQAIAVAALAQTTGTAGGATTQRPTDASTSRGTTATTAGPNAPSTAGSNAASGRSGGDASMDHSTMDHSTMDRSSMKTVTPQSFATQAAVMGKAEVELANLALQNTKNEEIRLYAERLIKDHTTANNKLKDIASKENISLPQSLDAKHQQLKQQLSGLKEDAFDREYKKHMMQSHDEAVALFESASQSEQMPPDLKQFASAQVPVLEKHRKQAEGLDMRKKDGA